MLLYNKASAVTVERAVSGHPPEGNFEITAYTRKSAQVVTSLQTSCDKLLTGMLVPRLL